MRPVGPRGSTVGKRSLGRAATATCPRAHRDSVQGRGSAINAINGNQGSSEILLRGEPRDRWSAIQAINGNQWQSMAIHGNPWQSRGVIIITPANWRRSAIKAINGNPWQSRGVVIITPANWRWSAIKAIHGNQGESSSSHLRIGEQPIDSLFHNARNLLRRLHQTDHATIARDPLRPRVLPHQFP